MIPAEREIFGSFFECWLRQQEQDLQALLSAAAAASSSSSQEDDDRHLRLHVERVIGHYEYYYRAKSASAKCDVLPMFTPTWTSSTENLFLWVGGWRPTTAFHVLYSKSGLQLESYLTSLSSLGVVTAPDLAGLDSTQLNRVDRLQRETIRLEKEISEEEAAAQESVASSHLVDLSQGIGKKSSGGVETMMEEVMKRKREKMARVLERADRLRLETIKGVVEILRPLQAVHFLIAAAELLLSIHEFGKNADLANGLVRKAANRSGR